LIGGAGAGRLMFMGACRPLFSGRRHTPERSEGATERSEGVAEGFRDPSEAREKAGGKKKPLVKRRRPAPAPPNQMC